MSQNKHSKLKFFIPADIEKGVDAKGRETMIIKGIASTGDLDSQDEYLDPSGMDLSGFKWVNWNHQGSKDPATIIGEPIKKSITPNNELYIEAVLYPDVPMAVTAYNLMKSLQNSPNGNKLGFSVEGKVIQKDPTRPNRIAKSRITGVALCPVPINGKTWADIVKGELPDEDTVEQYDTEFEQFIEKNMSVDNNSDENKVLTKSDVYIELYRQTGDKEQTKLLYPLVEKTAAMSKTPITNKTIEKAFEILELATKTPIQVSGGDGGSAFDTDLLEKAEQQFEGLIKEGLSSEEASETLITKGYNSEMIEFVAEKFDTPNQSGVSKKIEKSITDLGAIVKTSISVNDKKFAALADLFQQNLELMKSMSDELEELREMKNTFDKFAATPMPRKSAVSKSYTERFQKSDNGERVYNIKNKADLQQLKQDVHAMSGIEKGEKHDTALARVAQNIEIAGMLSPQDQNLLVSKGFNLVNE